MCFIDANGMSRRGFLAGSLAAGTAAAASLGRSLVLPGVAEGADAAPAGGGPGTAGVSFKWFGTNGWEITFGNKTILIDPWFNRFESGFLQNKLSHDTLLPTDTALIDQHVMRAAGVPEGKIVQVKGGEYMQFDGYSIEVFPSVHSMGGTKKYAVPGHLVSVPASPPTKVGDLPEGDTLIYVLRIAGKYTVFLMSSGNYVERALAGLKPDVALIAPLFSNNTVNFTPRLVRALNYPKLVLPTHWDNFEAPLTGTPTDLRAIYGDPANDLWVKEMKKVTP